MRNRWALAAVLALSLAAAASGAGAAADPPAGAVRAAWTPHGTPVAGASATARAPRLAAGGTYRDTIGPGTTRIYALRLDADSADYLSAFALPPAGSRVGFLDGISLRLVSAGREQCDQYDARFRSQDAAVPVGGYVQRQPTVSPLCRQAGDYFLYVRRDSAQGGDTSAWGLEIRFMVEPALRGAPSTGPAPVYPSAAPVPESAPPEPVRGASSIDDATELAGSGAWRDHLMPGQSAFYRVALGWGQQLRVTGAFSAARTSHTGGFSVSGARIDVYNTARGLVDDTDASYDGKPAAVTASTAPVAYANRASDDPRVKASPFAGWYYLQVTLHPDVAAFTTGGADVTLRVARTGTPTAAPDYVSDPAAAGFGADVPSTAPTTSAPAPAPAPRPARDGTLRTAGYGALGVGTLLLVWLAGWTLWARRARGRAVRR